MLPLALRSLLLSFLALPLTAQSGPVTDALAGLDPVALARGRELPGDPARVFDHGRFRYRFANEETLATFANDPERWAIQLGGGCAGMGPLAGVGRPELFAVHDQRVFVFASEACRARFLADPGAQIDREDPPAEGSEEAASAARDLLERAVEAIGGAAALDGFAGLGLVSRETAEWDGRRYESGSELLFLRPDRVRMDTWWDGWRRSDVVAGDRGAVTETGSNPEGTWPHAPSQSSALVRHVRRLPIVILRARGRPDFRAFHAGTEGDGATELVACSFAGTTTTLDIDRDTGRILAIRYHDRLPTTPRGDVRVTFDDFRPVGDLTLPFRSVTTLAGRPPVDRQWTTIRLLTDADADRFTLPAHD